MGDTEKSGVGRGGARVPFLTVNAGAGDMNMLPKGDIIPTGAPDTEPRPGASKQGKRGSG